MHRSELYDRAFFAAQEDESYRSAQVVLATLFASYRPASVVDVGCGVGPWLQAAVEAGIPDAIGVDGDHVELDQLRVPADRFVAHDLSTPLDLGRRFDLAVCVEVAEHLPESAAPVLVRTLTTLAPVVLFSAAVPHQGGDGHLNEQWPPYWAARFAEHGYAAHDGLRPALWDDERVAWWYRQNVVVYAPPDVDLAEALGRAGVPPAVVHPLQVEAILTRPAGGAAIDPGAGPAPPPSLSPAPEPALRPLLAALPGAARRAATARWAAGRRRWRGRRPA